MSGCTICGSGAVRQRELADGRVQHLCRAHEYACRKHLKDPCPICDGGEPDPDDAPVSLSGLSDDDLRREIRLTRCADPWQQDAVVRLRLERLERECFYRLGGGALATALDRFMAYPARGGSAAQV